MNITIENAREEHAPAISQLCEELGYPITTEEVLHNLEVLGLQPGHIVWVAINEQKTVGWCHAGKTNWVMMEPAIEIFGLVVDSRFKGMGIGKKLMSTVEDFAKDQNVKEMWVRSNRKRTESHPFYLGLGFKNLKDQAVYAKEI